MRRAWPWLATGVIAALLGVVAASVPVDWQRWEPATCMPARCFCEALGDGFVRQPANTWSNLAFVLVGLLIAAGVVGPRPRPLGPVPIRDHLGVRALFAALPVGLGLGSWLYHASMTFVGQWLDVMGMFVIPTFLILYTLLRVNLVTVRGFALAWVIVNAAIGYGLVVIPTLRRQGFFVFVLALLGAELWVRRRRPVRRQTGYLVGAIAAIAIAFAIWYVDLEGLACDPHSLLQGHAAWHLLCALCVLLTYVYYASERDGP